MKKTLWYLRLPLSSSPYFLFSPGCLLGAVALAERQGGTEGLGCGSAQGPGWGKETLASFRLNLMLPLSTHPISSTGYESHLGLGQDRQRNEPLKMCWGTAAHHTKLGLTLVLIKPGVPHVSF